MTDQSDSNATHKADAIIVGGGPVGWVSALALLRAGYQTTLVAPAVQKRDYRTIALMQGSLEFLRSLDLIPEEMEDSTPLEIMRMVDATERLIRAPEVEFDAKEIGFPCFALNIPVEILIKSIKSAIDGLPGFKLVDGIVENADLSENPKLTLADGQVLTAKLIVAADGKASKIRELSGIALQQWAYPQCAFVTQFSHSRPHNNVSTEFHTKTGPFTLVPLHGNRSSLVWVETPEKVQELMAMDDAALSAEIEQKSSHLVGKISILERRQFFPMNAQIAKKMGSGPVFLVGESGHAFPPIGAQGLNLGIRDIKSMVEALAANPGDFIANLSEAYAKNRQLDVKSRTYGVDLLNRSLLSDLLPVQMLRGLGLFAAGSIPSIRKSLMRQGVGV
ncbi:MAG: 2-octaprenyl-6-methoxyphenyl hydroxylase [Hyphomicrobiales bacterium]|nr:MAG: 2-octaprenyl-6-methoxyphenyl hydroxylase [Hyphomicrobiales bacterium]